jgi:hypothetical protein
MRVLRLWAIHHPTLAVLLGATALLTLAQTVPIVLAQPAEPSFQAMWALCQAHMAQFSGTMSGMMGSLGSHMGSMMGPIHGMGLR